MRESSAANLSGDLAGPIGAPVVDHDDLEIGIVLAGDRREAIGQVDLLILGRHDGRDPWRVGLVVSRRSRGEDILATQDDRQDNQANRPDRDDPAVDPQERCLGTGHDGDVPESVEV